MQLLAQNCLDPSRVTEIVSVPKRQNFAFPKIVSVPKKMRITVFTLKTEDN